MPFGKLLKKISKKKPPPWPSALSQGGTNQNNESAVLEKDTESKGLHLLNPSTSVSEDDIPYLADVVFVHGLNGHWSRTWTYEKNGTCWPRDLLPGTLPGARIFSYGYPSEIFASKSVAGVRDFAKDLLSDIGMRQSDSVS